MTRFLAFLSLILIALALVLIGARRSDAQTAVDCDRLAQQIACGCLILDYGETLVIVPVSPEQVAEWRALYSQQCSVPLVTATPPPVSTPLPLGTPLAVFNPGCDAFMPEGIGLVRFVRDTDLLWDHVQIMRTGLQVLAGQTALLVGVRGDYAEIVWACDVLWVALADVERAGG